MAEEQKKEQETEEIDPITQMSMKLDALEKQMKERDEALKATQKMNNDLIATNKRLLSSSISKESVQAESYEQVMVKALRKNLGI